MLHDEEDLTPGELIPLDSTCVFYTCGILESCTHVRDSLLPGLTFGFPANLSKEFNETQKKFYKVIIVIFMGFKTEIFYFKTNLVTHKIYFISKLPLIKLRKVRKCFPALFMPLFAQIWGRKAIQNFRPRHF